MANPVSTKTRKSCFLAIHGAIGAGKDTAALYLEKTYGFKIMHFAAPLKDACAAMYGVERKLFDEPIQKNIVIPYWKLSPRQMCTKVGTDLVRDGGDPDHWVKRAHLEVVQNWLKKGDNTPERYVFADTRFQNEVDYVVNSENGWLLEIRRPINPLKKIAENAAQGAVHKSETQVLNAGTTHYSIINDSTKEALYENLDAFMNLAVQIN